MQKIKVGIFFGGNSREREVSFAGGRTVYDNLDKSIFEAIPVFVDSYGNFCLLNWQNIYKGSIRDFYPPSHLVPDSEYGFQIYAESLGDISRAEQLNLLRPIGKPVAMEELPALFDIAFLALHGKNGEDGRIQGILEYLNIPYTGSSILPASLGMNKAVQKQWMGLAGFAVPESYSITAREWRNTSDIAALWEAVKEVTGLPCVIKSANQGSSIGVHVLENDDPSLFEQYVNSSFFSRRYAADNWQQLSLEEKLVKVASICDFREGMGMPIYAGINGSADMVVFHHPDALFRFFESSLISPEDYITLASLETEHEVLIESFIKGKEFSCIVIEDEEGTPKALPPTEIRKGQVMFDYRSKYLPGLSRKITPIQVPVEMIEKIRKECERLYTYFRFNVYARIDGFITGEGTLFLNDPNTTSGMMPSSFFFHQAAEIGLNPSSFLTYIIATSLRNRTVNLSDNRNTVSLQERLFTQLVHERNADTQKLRVAVIMGGYSSERHISIESGRNIYEKLASSEKYKPVPVFLTGSDGNHELYIIPINIMLKDNADDIAEKVRSHKENDTLQSIREEFNGITGFYGSPLSAPVSITYDTLKAQFDEAFIALHGRPGEDGEVQKHLLQIGLPFNGSGVESSQLTINKYVTSNTLRQHGILVALNYLMYKKEFSAHPLAEMQKAIDHLKFPMIAKPADDGCSTGVKKITSLAELQQYCEAAFRNTDELSAAECRALNLKPNEEFPRKEYILLEEMIQANGADVFMETTTGLLTRFDAHGNREYEIFETSESLAGSGILSLEEKFLAGEGQNITPARFSKDITLQNEISIRMRKEIEKTARLLSIEGYARIDNFVRVYLQPELRVETIIIEANSLPGMTPATCIFHQCALRNYKPYDFIDAILEYGRIRQERS